MDFQTFKKLCRPANSQKIVMHGCHSSIEIGFPTCSLPQFEAGASPLWPVLYLPPPLTCRWLLLPYGFFSQGNRNLLMWLGITNENKQVAFYVASQEGPGRLSFPSAQQFTLRALHGCHREFIIRNTTAGLAVNGLKWLLTATLALSTAPQVQRVRPKLREGSLILEICYWHLNNFVFFPGETLFFKMKNTVFCVSDGYRSNHSLFWLLRKILDALRLVSPWQWRKLPQPRSSGCSDCVDPVVQGRPDSIGLWPKTHWISCFLLSDQQATHSNYCIC